MPLAGGWLTPFMIISGGNLASVAASSGANSTMRNLVPLSGGDTPIGRFALSSLDRLGGVSSVIQKLVEEITGLSTFRRHPAVEQHHRMIVGIEAGHYPADIVGSRARCDRNKARG
jgi:hypothetical protein